MISRVGCLQTGVFSLPRIWPLELHWPRAPMDSTGRWYVASDVWHPTLFRSGVQCIAHRTTHTHRRLDCPSRTRTRKPLHSSPPSPPLPQPPSHHGPVSWAVTTGSRSLSTRRARCLRSASRRWASRANSGGSSSTSARGSGAAPSRSAWSCTIRGRPSRSPFGVGAGDGAIGSVNRTIALSWRAVLAMRWSREIL
jgi:hypothetical protein